MEKVMENARRAAVRAPSRRSRARLASDQVITAAVQIGGS